MALTQDSHVSQRLAAPAPFGPESAASARECDPRTAHLHALCEDWSTWCRTRRYIGGPRPLAINSLARWAAPMRCTASTGRDAGMSAELQRFNTAVVAQPPSKAKQAFILYYLDRVRPVKKIADALGVGRPHIYTLIDEFRSSAARSAAALAEAADTDRAA